MVTRPLSEGPFSSVSRWTCYRMPWRWRGQRKKATRSTLDEDAILFFRDELREGNIRSKKNRTMLLSVFVNQVNLYKDRVVLFLNAGKQEIEITKQLREDVEGIFENDSSTEGASASTYVMDVGSALGRARLFCSPTPCLTPAASHRTRPRRLHPHAARASTRRPGAPRRRVS